MSKHFTGTIAQTALTFAVGYGLSCASFGEESTLHSPSNPNSANPTLSKAMIEVAKIELPKMLGKRLSSVELARAESYVFAMATVDLKNTLDLLANNRQLALLPPAKLSQIISQNNHTCSSLITIANNFPNPAYQKVLFYSAFSKLPTSLDVIKLIPAQSDLFVPEFTNTLIRNLVARSDRPTVHSINSQRNSFLRDYTIAVYNKFGADVVLTEAKIAEEAIIMRQLHSNKRPAQNVPRPTSLPNCLRNPVIYSTLASLVIADEQVNDNMKQDLIAVLSPELQIAYTAELRSVEIRDLVTKPEILSQKLASLPPDLRENILRLSVLKMPTLKGAATLINEIHDPNIQLKVALQWVQDHEQQRNFLKEATSIQNEFVRARVIRAISSSLLKNVPIGTGALTSK